MDISCPCCQSRSAIGDETEFRCTICTHQWRKTALPDGYYASCAGRNTGMCNQERKYADRMTGIEPHISAGLRVLEIGCADGALGALVKGHADIHYVGLEISPDASVAENRLDHVHRGPTCSLDAAPFDLLLAFHVLEHLVDIEAEVSHWRRLLKSDGRLIVEVPHRAGHPLLDHDRHPEHIHQFSAASLTILLDKAGLTPTRVSTGHFESVVYSDSLRIEAQVARSPEQKTEQLLSRFATLFSGQFVVYGTGGDFHNYVEFLLSRLPVAALCDTDPERWGRKIGSHAIIAYDPVALSSLPILIASTRHEGEIRSSLLAQGIPESSLISLSQIYG